MGHDAHYLSRLDRLGRDHTERALALYRDHERVAFILQYLNLPESAERVAISLDDPESGPFLIVARNGHFVTCLGPGMRPHEDQVVVTRAQLETLSERHGVVRELLDEAKKGDDPETTRLFSRVRDGGDRLTREQFEAVARWTPVLGDTPFKGMMVASEGTAGLYDELKQLKRLDTVPKGPLQMYWRSAWGTAHYAMLMGADGGMALTRLWVFKDFREELGEEGVLLAGWIPFLFGVSSIAARGAWLSAMLPEHTLGPLERAYASTEEPETTIAFGLALHAIGMRHRREEARVRKALARKSKSTHAPTLAARERIQRATKGASANVADSEAALVRYGREALAAHVRDRTARYDFAVAPEALPDEVAAAYALALPIGLDAEASGVECLAEWMPHLVSLEPAQLYLSEQYLRPKPVPWDPQEAVQLVKARMQVEAWRQPQPVRAAARPGRNDPCSCGSGKKYKRCCGAVAGD